MTDQKSPRVTLHTSMGDIALELFAPQAPDTTANFLHYADSGHYDQLVFHRVIPGFMIQGGGFTADMHQKPTANPIRNEAAHGADNHRGTIAMARTSDPHSATCQFFINVADNDFLNHTAQTPQGWGYAVFGKVVEGMDVVDTIAAVPTGRSGPHSDVPLSPVVIQSVTVSR